MTRTIGITALVCATVVGTAGAANTGSSAVVELRDGTRMTAAGRAGVKISADGRSWQQTASAPLAVPGVGDAAVITYVFSGNGESAIAGDDFGRLYRSDDGGATWLPSSAGLPVPFAFRTQALRLAADPARSNHVYALVQKPVNSERTDTFIYRSEDGAKTWRPLKEVRNGRDFDALAVSNDGGVKVTLTGIGRSASFVDRSALGRESMRSAESLAAVPHRAPVPRTESHGSDIDVGSVAVLYDDGTFVSINDLAPLFQPTFPNTVIRYTPVAPPSYRLTLQLPTAVLVGTGRDLALDGLTDEVPVAKPLPFPFTFFGVSYPAGTNLYISDNGNIMIGAQDPFDTFETETQLSTGAPRIAAMWDDLDPSAGGTVWYDDTTAGQLTVSWLDVPEFLFTDTNRFAVTLYMDGRIDMTYEKLSMFDGLTGLSPGGPTAALSYADFSRDIPFTSPFGEAVYEWFHNEFWTARVAQRFYACHADVYDQLVVVGQMNYPYPTAGSQEPFQFPIAFSDLVKNDVSGIGLDPTLDRTAAYGSAGVLRNIAVGGTFLDYPDVPTDPLDTVDPCRPASGVDVFAQQIGHQWLAYVDRDDGAGMDLTDLRGRNGTHWSFFHDTNASVMEGVLWRDNLDGTFDSIEGFERFSALDLYLMGLTDPSAVPNFTLLGNFLDRGDCGGGPDTCRPDSTPDICATATATATAVTVASVITAEGPRLPPPSPIGSVLRLAWILVVPPADLTYSVTELAKTDAYRTAFESFWSTATTGLSAANSTLVTGGMPASTGVGNTLRATHEFHLNVKLDWRMGRTNPPRYVMHMTTNKTELVDTAVGIGSTLGVHTDIEFFRDFDAISGRPMMFFYEAHWRDCADVTQYP